MTNIYKLQVRAMCPIHNELIDIYQVTVESSATIPVERILEHFKQYEKRQIFQEDMTHESATALGCSICTVGTHSGVEITSCAP